MRVRFSEKRWCSPMHLKSVLYFQRLKELYLHCSLLWKCHISSYDKMYYGGGSYRCGEISFPVFYLIFSPFASLYCSSQPWANGITLCLPHQALAECTETSGKRNKMAVKMQTLEVKEGGPSNLSLNLKGAKWGASGQFILLFTDNKSLCFYVLSLVFHNLFERRWEIM